MENFTVIDVAGKYEIVELYVRIISNENGSYDYGTIYPSLDGLRADYPDDLVLLAYGVQDENGLIPPEDASFYYSLEDVYMGLSTMPESYCCKIRS